MSENDEGNFSDTISSLVGFIIRRRWWILGTAFLTTCAVTTYVSLLPNRYSSEATIVVVQQQVSQAYVPSAMTMNVADAVNAMTREILSRARLLAIIDEFGLYSKEKKRLSPERLAEQMRKDVNIEPLDRTFNGNLGAFQISFTADSAALAQAVTNRLTLLFIDENSKTREDRATRTTGFLAEQLEATKNNLVAQEERLRDFKMRNLGELPEQQAANLGTLTDLRMQLTNTMASLTRAHQQQAFLESLVVGALARLGSERATLLTRFTPKYPDVAKKDQEIAAMEALLARVKTGTSGTEGPEISAMPENTSIAQLRSQVDANSTEITRLLKEEQALRREIGDYQNRVKATPVREQQLSTILRDYELFKKDYTDLMSKQLQSQLTASLERRQEGERFRLVDPPVLPFAPTSPKRVKLSLGGAASGVLLGFALAFLVDSKDRSFHAEEEVLECLKLPVIALPLLFTPSEQRSRNWTKSVEWAAGSVMTIAVLAVEYYIYKHP